MSKSCQYFLCVYRRPDCRKTPDSADRLPVERIQTLKLKTREVLTLDVTLAKEAWRLSRSEPTGDPVADCLVEDELRVLQSILAQLHSQKTAASSPEPELKA